MEGGYSFCLRNWEYQVISELMGLLIPKSCVISR